MSDLAIRDDFVHAPPAFRLVQSPPSPIVRTLRRFLAEAASNAVAIVAASAGGHASEAAVRIAAEASAAGCRCAVLDDRDAGLWRVPGDAALRAVLNPEAFDLVLVASEPPCPVLPCAGALVMVEEGASRMDEVDAVRASCARAEIAVLGLLWWAPARAR